MCGFAGLVSAFNEIDPKATLQAMADSIEHRGPDSEGIWTSETLGVGLSHRRLAIQDLSPLGHQPMLSSSGRYAIAFNGEVYNFNKIREELEKFSHTFKGHSDTEVMLAAFEQWGIEASLKKFNGMFAFALVDQKDKKLYLARDRFGEKPLFIAKTHSGIAFGSEIRIFKHLNNWDRELNRASLAQLAMHNFISGESTIYRNVRRLPQATCAVYCLKNRKFIDEFAYWQLSELSNIDETLTRESAAEMLDSTLHEVIAEQMISDAPIGAFLSGGVDSSTTVAVMQNLASNPVKTFTIGFNDPQFNEAKHAKKVASHLGTEHYEHYFSSQEALNLVPELANIYDEPFADSSQLPTVILSRLAKQHVTVSLSGDGGDELFTGYTRYFEMKKQLQQQNSTTNRLLKTFCEAERPTANILSSILSPVLRKPRTELKDKLIRKLRLAGARNLPKYYQASQQYNMLPEQLIKGYEPPNYQLNNETPTGWQNDPLKECMWHDMNWYLPDDILTKVDRAAMSASLETRVPMLDPRIVELAMKCQSSLNVDNGVGKQVLRSVLFKYVPRELIERPKVGFAVPIASWLRNDLCEWAQDLLTEDALRKSDAFDPKTVREMWRLHLDGETDYSFQLWGILMFQSWNQKN